MYILHFTDSHLFASPAGELHGANTDKSLSRVIKLALRKHPGPKAVVVTGDLSHDGSVDSYRRLTEHFSVFGCPVFVLGGNHDSLPNLAAVAGSSGGAIQHGHGFFAGGWNILMLDTVVAGEVGGAVSDKELFRLDQALTTRAQLNTLICMHHQPVPVGSAWLDAIGLSNGGQMLDTVKRHGNVRGILWGHIHQEYDDTLNGVRMLSTPATNIQFAPNARKFALEERPPGYRWLKLNGDGTIDTGVRRLPNP